MESIFSSENNDFEHVLCGCLILFYIATAEAILNHNLDDMKPSKQEHWNCQLLVPPTHIPFNRYGEVCK